MAFRLLARLTLPLVIVLAALLGIICVMPYNASTVDAFFDTACTLSMPCLQGIRPGETTYNQALAVLQSHPWVDEISQVFASPKSNQSGTVLIYWTWSDAYPFTDLRSQSNQGIIVADQGVVTQVYLTTSLTLGDLWLALGGAEGRVLNALSDQMRPRVDNTALFVRDGVAATAARFADCSTDLASFWHTPVYLWLRDNLPLPNRLPVGLQYRQLRTSLLC